MSERTEFWTEGQSHGAFADSALLIGRLAMAYIFVPSGFGKLMALGAFADHLAGMGIPPAYAYPVAVLAATVEFAGSVLIVLGLWTRPVALLMVVFTVVAAVTAHHYWDLSDQTQVRGQMINFDKNIAIAGGFLVLAAVGAGRWSLDRRGR